MIFKPIIFLILICLTSLYGQTSKNNPEDILESFKTSIKEETNKNYEKALDTMLKFYDVNKSSYLMNLRLGWLYYLNKDDDKSQRFYMEAAKLSNNSVESMLGLTYPYSAMSKWDSVKNIYRGIIKIDNYNYTANLKLAQILINSKEYQKAENLLDKLHNIYPSDYQVNIQLGWLYYYKGNNKKAKSFFSEALCINPGNKTAEKGLRLTK